MPDKVSPYDPADDLYTDVAIAVFTDEAFGTADLAYAAHALGVVARAKGTTQVAMRAGLSREQLCRSLSENGNPTLSTTLAVLDALGFGLAARPRKVN